MSYNLPGQQQFYEMYLEFHEKIFITHVQCMQHLVAIVPFEQLNKIDVSQRLSQNKSILDENSFIIEEKEFEYIFDLIVPTFKKYSYRQKEAMLRLEELNNKRKFSLIELVIAQVMGDRHKFTEISDKYDIPSFLLEKVIEYISSPYLELCAEFFNKKVTEFGWNQPSCPICGSLPTMAKVNEKVSSRILWCRFCDSTWSFPEQKCPSCLSNDLKSVRMIFPSNRKPIRIDACSQCKNYIKTIDELLNCQKFHFSVKHVETYYLDLLAMSHGFNVPDYLKFFLESI